MTPYRKAFHLCPTRWCRNRKAPKRGNCSKCAMREWRAANPVKCLLAWLRWTAKKKGVPFDLTLDWLTAFLRDNGYDRTVHHIDRIRTWEGYTMGNLQVLVAAENIAKGNRERWVEQPF
jgi:hypothetical protein